MGKKLIYFIGSDFSVGKKTLDEVSKLKGFDKVVPFPEASCPLTGTWQSLA